jgi:2-polyprenyl-6-methoxyphenol hydroxylase-like FAD-dependent oxidoreductase
MARTIDGLRVAIVGGSLGGLLAANMLHRAGCDVTVHERVDQGLAGRGVGLATHPELFAAFQRIGVPIGREVGVEIEGRVVFDLDGSVRGRHRLPQVMASWGHLFRLLKDAFPAERYLSGASFVSAEQSGDGVCARFTDGREIDADLLVGADGVRSTVRGQYLPDVAPIYAGYCAWRGVAPEAAIPSETRDSILSWLAFCLQPGEQVLGYTVAGDDDDLRPGYRRYNFVWYRTTDDQALRRMLTDKKGQYHAEGIPPALMHPDVVAELREAARTRLAPQFNTLVDLIDTPFFQVIADLECPRMVFGRVALMGDAAFVARPHGGMGVTKAAGDAMLLADALLAFPKDIDHALAVYEAERMRFGSLVVRCARELGAHMKQTFASDEERALAEHHRDPEVLMREVALPPVLS